MALPKLVTPTYELTIPSTGKEVSYRPFLVKEEKILLMALDSEDNREQVKAIRQIMNNCILDDVNTNDLPMFDLEYIFLQLRSKSVGEVVSLEFNCEGCGTPIQLDIDISKIEIKKTPGHTNKVEISDEIGMILNYPKMDVISLMGGEDLEDNKKSFDILLNMIVGCVDSIYDNDQVYKSEDSTPEEMKEFLLNLSQTQFEKINQFFETMPKLEHQVNVTCNKCDYKEERTIQGMQSFFG